MTNSHNFKQKKAKRKVNVWLSLHYIKHFSTSNTNIEYHSSSINLHSYLQATSDARDSVYMYIVYV